MAIPLAKDGLREMIVGTLVLAGGSTAAIILTDGAWYGWVIAVPLLAVWVWLISFFRDPRRPTPTDPGLFISPADGTVSDITPLGTESELGCEGVRIGIFMSVFNAHVNRAPCDATVIETKCRKGKFLDARDSSAGAVNEAVTIRLNVNRDGRELPLIVRQVAGFVARRIICRVKPSQAVCRGQRIGLIKFGSRVELWLPAELAGEVRVQVGQKVRAGLSILAAENPRKAVNA